MVLSHDKVPGVPASDGMASCVSSMPVSGVRMRILRSLSGGQGGPARMSIRTALAAEATVSCLSQSAAHRHLGCPARDL